jgi:hypothetical protein
MIGPTIPWSLPKSYFFSQVDLFTVQHEFQWVIAAVGSSVHQDGSLAQVYCTNDATDVSIQLRISVIQAYFAQVL